MQSKPISEYIDFGTELRYLQDIKENYRLHSTDDGMYVLGNLKRFLDRLDNFNLPVTKRAAFRLEGIYKKLQERVLSEFLQAKKNIRKKHSQQASLKELHELIDNSQWNEIPDLISRTDFSSEVVELIDEQNLAADEAHRIRLATHELRPTLEAEAEGNIAFIVNDKRIDVNKLLSDVSMLMAPGTFGSLPDIAQYDFVQAGRSIAFELPTAAAFHLLRGTESALRTYYYFYADKNEQISWGPIVARLRKLQNSPPESLLDNLDNIRRSFRNPTQHPEKIYDIHEVQDLFGLCIEVVNRMVKDSNWRSDTIE